MSLYTMSVELWSEFVPCFHVFCAHFSLGFEEKSVENEWKWIFSCKKWRLYWQDRGTVLKMFRAVLCFSFCLISDKAEEFSAENSPCMSLQREAIQNPWMRRSENCVLCLTIEKRTNLPVDSSIRNCIFLSDNCVFVWHSKNEQVQGIDSLFIFPAENAPCMSLPREAIQNPWIM